MDKIEEQRKPIRDMTHCEQKYKKPEALHTHTEITQQQMIELTEV